jgi:hypothetical protein
MQPALMLTEQERLYFMQALNAVAWAVAWRSDGRPGEEWQNLLKWISSLLGTSEIDYQFRASVPGIAEKVGQISDPRARLYFIRIVHDIYWLEFKNLDLVFFGEGQQIACRKAFKPVYEQLTKAIQLD